MAHPAVALFNARLALQNAQQNAAACEKDFGAACLCSETDIAAMGLDRASQNAKNIERTRVAMRTAYDRVVAAEFEVSHLTKIVAKQVDDDIAAEKTAARLRHDAIVAADLEKGHRLVVQNLLEEQKRVYEERTAALIAVLVEEDEVERKQAENKAMVKKQIAADRAYAESLEKQ